MCCSLRTSSQALTFKDLESAATPIGWRYVVANGGQPTITADLNRPHQKLYLYICKLVGLTAQWVAQLAAAAVKATELFGADDQENYEVRLLEIPSLSKQTLWLHGPTGDHFLPAC